MQESQDIRRGRHCFFNLHAHLVFVTKYRRGVLSNAMLDSLKSIFADVCIDLGSELVEFNGEDDHVHLHVIHPPNIALSILVNSLKGVSSRLLRKKYGEELQRHLWANALWSPSYFAASCSGAPLEKLKAYIEFQRRPKAKDKNSS